MTTAGTGTEGTQVISSQLRGETMAYAAQSGLYNLGANIFEPYINHLFQQHYATGGTRAGSYGQNLMGELAGDVIGSSTLMLAEMICPVALHTFTRHARNVVDPLYTSVAHVVFADECRQPDYAEKVEKWKTFQERNLVRSAIVAGAGIAGNIATQKMLIGNPAPTGLIFKGKLLSTAITTCLGLGVRFAFPDQMRRMDKWVGGAIAPMMEEKSIPVR